MARFADAGTRMTATASVAARLAGGDIREIATAGKPGCYGDLVDAVVAARLAGGGVREIATAGKPGCYGSVVSGDGAVVDGPGAFKGGFQVDESAMT